MSNLDKNALKIACSFIASCIGAGFASGKETVNFFLKYGKISIYGLFLSGILFMVFTYALFNMLYAVKRDKKDFSEYVFSKKLSGLFAFISDVFLFFLLTIMIAGMGSCTNDFFNINKNISCILWGVICFIILSLGKDAVINSSLVSAPILCFGILFTGGYFLLLSDIPVFNSFQKNNLSWIISSILYVSFNTIPLICFFTSSKHLFTSKKMASLSSVTGSGVLMLISIVLYLVLNIFYTQIENIDMPMLFITRKIGFSATLIYTLTLYIAMLSTALSCGFSLTDKLFNITNYKKNHIIFGVVFLSTALSMKGFSSLIETIYPLFGWLGLYFMICIILKYYFRNKKL